MAEYHHRVAAHHLVLTRQDAAAERGSHAHNGKVVAAYGLAPDALRLAFDSQAGGNQGEMGAHTALKDLQGLVAIVEEVGIGIRFALREGHQPPGAPHRQHAPEQAIRDTEHGGVRANPQRNRDDNDQREAGSL